MELHDFLEYVKERRALDTEEIFSFMNVMSDEARRITFALNGAYHTPEEVRDLLSRLFGRPVDPTLRVFPPFYTDFGKNIHFSGPWRGVYRRRMSNRTQRRVCHTQPLSGA